MSSAELQSLKHKYLDAPLPSGFWFDGSDYFDHTGAMVGNTTMMDMYFNMIIISCVFYDNIYICFTNIIGYLSLFSLYL